MNQSLYPTRCLSSLAMEKVIGARNHVMMTKVFNIRNTPGRIGAYVLTAVVTEVALAVLNVISIVESLAYGIFTLMSLPFAQSQAHQKGKKLLESSSFTILWTLADMVIYNPFFSWIHTNESLAREFAEFINPTRITLSRPEDIGIVASYRLPTHAQEIDYVNEMYETRTNARRDEITQGANKIVEISENIEVDDLTDVKGMKLILFRISTLLFFDKEALPSYLHSDTRSHLRQLRQNHYNLSETIKDRINQIVKLSSEEFDNLDLDNESNQLVKDIVKKLMHATGSEWQQGILLKFCLKKAYELKS